MHAQQSGRPAPAELWRAPADTGESWRASRRPLLVMLLGLVASVALLLGGHVPSVGWHARYAALADDVVGGLPLAGQRQVMGNSLCFDVCREVSSTYAVQRPAPETVESLRQRMLALGMTEVSADCPSRYTTCSAQGRHGSLWVWTSQETRPEWSHELRVQVVESRY